jgi:hypothetical protein
MVNVYNARCKLKTKLSSGIAEQFTDEQLGIHEWFTTPALAAAVMQLTEGPSVYKPACSNQQTASMHRQQKHAGIKVGSCDEVQAKLASRYTCMHARSMRLPCMQPAMAAGWLISYMIIYPSVMQCTTAGKMHEGAWRADPLPHHTVTG